MLRGKNSLKKRGSTSLKTKRTLRNKKRGGGHGEFFQNDQETLSKLNEGFGGIMENETTAMTWKPTSTTQAKINEDIGKKSFTKTGGNWSIRTFCTVLLDGDKKYLCYKNPQSFSKAIRGYIPVNDITLMSSDPQKCRIGLGNDEKQEPSHYYYQLKDKSGNSIIIGTGRVVRLEEKDDLVEYINTKLKLKFGESLVNSNDTFQYPPVAADSVAADSVPAGAPAAAGGNLSRKKRRSSKKSQQSKRKNKKL